MSFNKNKTYPLKHIYRHKKKTLDICHGSPSQEVDTIWYFVYTCYIEFRRLSPKPRSTGQPRIPLLCLW